MERMPSTRPKKSTTVRLSILALRSSFRLLGAVAPDLGARLAEWIWSRPPPPRYRPEERAALARAAPRRLEVGEGQIAVYEWGESGPAALFVHGWGGHGGQIHALVEPLLAAGRRVVSFDAPGHGASVGGRPTMPAFAEAIRALDRELGGIELLVAHSFGSGAAGLAFEAGVRPQRAVFFGPAANMHGAAWRFARALAIPHEVRVRMERRLEARYGIRIDDLDLLRVAPRAEIPLLVVHDRYDREVPFEEGERIAARWPGARMLRTGGLGHNRVLADPEVVAAVARYLVEEAPVRLAG